MNGCVIATYRCNAQCHMCGIWRSPSDPKDELDASYLERLPRGLGRINLTGGEPMLRDDIEDLVAALYDKADKVEISTNGYYTEKILSIANRFPKAMFRISLEGLPALNDSLRGTQNGFDHALRTMLGLLDSPAKDIGFSVVICDKNADDLLTLYRLCASMGVEFGNSVMHNSWYFHTNDNHIDDLDKAVRVEKAFIKALLQSPRDKLMMRFKDYLRAYFNINILNHLQGGDNILSRCVAGRDLFFIDPWGNVLPCNGSTTPWSMGNIKEKSFEEIWEGEEAEIVRALVDGCTRSCAFIGTARFDMRRHPVGPLSWIIRNKIRLRSGLEPLYEPRKVQR
jgi:Fe-coproporphyrin III synthase